MKLPFKAGLLTVGLATALGITFGMAYASFNRTFDLPIQATVTIRLASPEQAADLDGDGVVDGSDLLTVLEAFNTGLSGGDVDQSGTVDIFDLAYVARYIFQPVPPPPTPTPTPAPPTPTPTPIRPPTLTPTPTPGPIPYHASIQDFSHQDITIGVGTSIIWTNQGIYSHTTTSGVPGGQTGLWDTHLSGGQSSAQIAFNTQGNFSYFCRIHTSMRATVTVTP